MRATASAPSSPIASPPPVKISRKATTSASGTAGKRGRRSKADMAGLVGGDSDSSALTQESGDEVAVGLHVKVQSPARMWELNLGKMKT